MHRISCCPCSSASASLAEFHLESLAHDRRDPKVLNIQSLTFGHPPLIFQQEVSQGDLDLVGSKEPSRTGMFLVSESKIVFAGTDKPR